MKIAVFSDSHRDISGMIYAMEKEAPDVIIHLGDHAADARALQKRFSTIPMHVVCGNNDYSDDPLATTLELIGTKLLLTHGHEQRVKLGMDRLYFAGRSAEADIVLFGHTHRSYFEEHNGILFVNPGAVGGRSYTRTLAPSYGMIKLSIGQKADVNIHRIP